MNVDIDFVLLVCKTCGILYYVPQTFHEERKKRKGLCWYCPNGHSWEFTETEIDKLQKQLNMQQDELASMESEVRRLKNERTMLAEKLAHKGKKQCPHCSKYVVHLKRHTQKKHPEASAAIGKKITPKPPAPKAGVAT